MADKKEKKRRNSVSIVGFLRENNLEKVVNADGINVIRGSITIGTDDMSSHKVQFYVNEFKKNGEDNPGYAEIAALLPENTVSVASFLKDNPGTDFEVAVNGASKVWATANFEEYASLVGERTRSMITLRGIKAGIKDITPDKPYNPRAEFTVDVYISTLEKEEEGSEEEGYSETGRVLLTGLIPSYDKSVHQIEFVAPAEDNVAGYILNNYAVGDTVHVSGELVSLMIRKEVEQEETATFGKVRQTTQYETTFVRERKILGGDAQPIAKSDARYIKPEEVKEGLAARLIKMKKNGERSSSSEGTGTAQRGFGSNTATAAAKPAAPTTASFSADLDF